MKQPAYILDEPRRTIVLDAMKQVCQYRGWLLYAAHVRSTHVHIVLECDTAPEKAMNDFKAYASRALNTYELVDGTRKRWTRHGSTRGLWRDQDVRDVIRYVVDEQGQPMAVFCGQIP